MEKNPLMKEKIIREFCVEKEQGKVPHAILLISQDKLLNCLMARTLGILLICDNSSACGECGSCLKVVAETHPDFFVFPKNKNFVVDEANEIIEKAIQSPTISQTKVFIINDIDDATPQAQNKILKTLEEPSKSTIFILTATNENKILPTVVSRTRKEFLERLEQENVKELLTQTPKIFEKFIPKKNYIQGEIKNALQFGEGWVGKTLSCLNNEFFEKEKQVAREIVENFVSSKELPKFSYIILEFRNQIREFFEVLENEFEKKLLESNLEKSQGIIEIIEQINFFASEIEKNVSLNLIVDNMLMKILEIKYNYKI